MARTWPMIDISVLQGALRLLFLLDRAGAPPVPDSPAAKAGAVSVIESEKKLQALHFWMRNPDHLASDILTCIDRGEADGLSLETAEALLEGDEPELRLYPMLRHLFGAFEPIDDSMAHLVSVGLALCRRLGDPAGLKRTDFWLLAAGRAAAANVVEEFPQLRWYADRADLVALVARADSGNRLKDRHYLVKEYANTPHGQLIPPVADSVRRRLAEMRGSAS
jgi:hypothetical protein